MKPSIPFDNSYAALPEGFFARMQPRTASNPRLLAFNAPLAQDLGIAPTSDLASLAETFSGNALPEGADPLAQAYAGHQFGGFSPQLGDGRALLIGEVVDRHGKRRDLQLKGSGRTPFSRGGDGLAAMGPVLREYLISEAMFTLGVPTTRSLAAVATGDDVLRETPLPGAVLTRVAASHLRVGSFEFFAARRDAARTSQLLGFATERHYPQVSTPLEFLKAVIAAQAQLVAHWMSIGFIHGVMNTDNTTISGETIDYGPCAFMDGYHPATVYSSIDRQGRYAYDNQRHVLPWNMAQLASSLLLLEEDTETAVQAYTQAVHEMPALIDAAWLQRFGAKLGMANATVDDRPLIDELLALMANQGADFTNTFRALSSGDAKDAEALFVEPSALHDWSHRWHKRIEREESPDLRMRAVNPAVIARNHRVEQTLAAAMTGDMQPFQDLQRVLTTPFDLSDDDSEYAIPPRPDEEITATFCGT
ncbi:YdiU family protein [Pseudooceanicola sediminis]|uniref:Protein nucleotidyltransferase YdiU n=1 Tax=Pseudooceanicola sediminis TaxID=2211117 RepID=A0A399J8W0_9RHOB|nr:YdiU family protein [Pseudooceanicola sediminis]KAA2316897.1 YdiU family protein [Puniceibacterium sp. HSS470]RII40649.1 YdiU family protein [Pseudooceanicola sediminis]|tara:strand:+ start:101023 stop:102453 length:1431 start_codon:yes stop_codon:yes gene_type:complete